MEGYIKDYRQELQSDIWKMPPLYHRVWQWLKYQVNHSPERIPMRDGTFLNIERGQKLTSVRTIAENVAWYEGYKYHEPNPKTISTILDWLVKNEMIQIERGKGNRQYTLITLINWDIYQSKQDKGNSKETVREHLTDINKNEKNEKNEKKEEKTIRSKYKFEPDHMELAEYLFQRIQDNYPEYKKPSMDSWANTFRLMIERDNRKYESIKNCIDWVQNHSFWYKNILSPDKLRKQYDRLVIEAKEDKSKFGLIKGGKKDEIVESSYGGDYSKYNFRKGNL
jgi:predicted transcriptional regulator